MTYRSMPYLAAPDVTLFCSCEESLSREVGPSSVMRFQPWKLWARVSGEDVPVETSLPPDAMEYGPTAYLSQGKWLVYFTAGTWGRDGAMRFNLFRMETEDWRSFSTPRFVTGMGVRAGYCSPSYLAYSHRAPVGSEVKFVYVEKQSGRRVGAKASSLVVGRTTSFLAEDERKVIISGAVSHGPSRFSVTMDLRDGTISEILVNGASTAEASILGETAAYSVRVGSEPWQRDVVVAPFSLAESSVPFSMVKEW